VPIPAARTEEHARDSARSIEIVLTLADIAAIDDAEFSRA
jgi:aryl-alcohol dehydrogenase-like predicted oxidoreductase